MGIPRYLQRPLTPAQSLQQVQLVANWAFASSSGVKLTADPHGPTIYDLTNVNTVGAGTGPSNNLPNAANFAGTNQYLTAVVPAPRGEFAVDGWLRFAANNVTDGLIGQWDTTAQRGWQLVLSNGSINMQGSINGSATTVNQSLGSFNVDTWYYVVMQYSLSQNRFMGRVNMGPWVFSNALGGALWPSTNPVSFGAFSANGTFASFLTGLEAQFEYHNRLLPEAELLWRFNNGVGRSLARGA